MSSPLSSAGALQKSSPVQLPNSARAASQDARIPKKLRAAAMKAYGIDAPSPEKVDDALRRLMQLTPLLGVTDSVAQQMAGDRELLNELSRGGFELNSNGQVRRALTPALLAILVRVAPAGIGAVIAACRRADVCALIQLIAKDRALAIALDSSAPAELADLIERGKKISMNTPVADVVNDALARLAATLSHSSSGSGDWLAKIRSAGVVESGGELRFEGKSKNFPLEAVVRALESLSPHDPFAKALVVLLEDQMHRFSSQQLNDGGLYSVLVNVRDAGNQHGVASLRQSANHALGVFGATRAVPFIAGLKADKSAIADATELARAFIADGAYSTAIGFIRAIEKGAGTPHKDLARLLLPLLPELVRHLDVASLFKADKVMSDAGVAWSAAEWLGAIRDMATVALKSRNRGDIKSICTCIFEHLARAPGPHGPQAFRMLLSLYEGLAQVPTGHRAKAYELLSTVWNQALKGRRRGLVLPRFNQLARAVVGQLPDVEQPSLKWFRAVVLRIQPTDEPAFEIRPTPQQTASVLLCSATVPCVSSQPSEVAVCVVAAQDIPLFTVSLFDPHVRQKAAIRMCQVEWKDRVRSKAKIILEIYPADASLKDLLSDSMNPGVHLELMLQSSEIRRHTFRQPKYMAALAKAASSSLGEIMGMLPSAQTVEEKVARFIFLQEAGLQLAGSLKTTGQLGAEFAAIADAFADLLPEVQRELAVNRDAALALYPGLEAATAVLAATPINRSVVRHPPADKKQETVELANALLDMDARSATWSRFMGYLRAQPAPRYADLHMDLKADATFRNSVLAHFASDLDRELSVATTASSAHAHTIGKLRELLAAASPPQ